MNVFSVAADQGSLGSRVVKRVCCGLLLLLYLGFGRHVFGLGLASFGFDSKYEC